MPRYRNNLCTFYCCLVDHYGFHQRDVQVVYNNNGNYDFGWRTSPVGTKVATSQAAQTAITTALAGLTDDDLFVLYTTNHGTATGRLNLWGGGEYLDLITLDTLLAANKQPYCFGVFGHCFSRDMADQFVASAGQGKGVAVSASNSSSTALPPDDMYDAFVYHFTTALQRQTPSGHPVLLDPNDPDDDSDVTVKQAFEFTDNLQSYKELRKRGGLMKDHPFLSQDKSGNLAASLTLRGRK